ncbi:hypothetical protein JW777_05325 [bacterium]|nr:hypothetical protein [bacterium]
MKRQTRIRSLKGEEGFWSAIILVFLITLGLLGLGAYSILRTESINLENETKFMQADAALTAGCYYSLNSLVKEVFNSTVEQTPLSVGGASVTCDTTSDGNLMRLTVTSTYQGAERQAFIEFQIGLRLRDKAIVTTDVDNGVSARDSLNRNDPNRLVQKADSIPGIKEDSLLAWATRQGHYIDRDAGDADVGNSFFQADGKTPNIYWITGNYTVSGSNDQAGIFVVLGDVTINGADRIKGIVYLPNPTSTIIHGGGKPTQNSIEGALISHGAITGTGSHANVKHRPLYMNVFCDNFQKYGDSIEDMMTLWIYT